MSMLSFDAYVAALSQLSSPFDPVAPTPESDEIRGVAQSIMALDQVDIESLAGLVSAAPNSVPVLGLAIGLTREKLKNVLRHHLGTAAWQQLARTSPSALIATLDQHYELVRLIQVQRNRSFDFGDLLVARAGTRHTAAHAGVIGRRIEDEIETIASDLGLSYVTRTRFEGRAGQTAPCDLAIPLGGAEARIVVAAKGFDSTGSKLTDAVREIEEMADKRMPVQFVMAVVDGIGWKGRLSDLRKIYGLRTANRIDGLYTLQTLGDFRSDLISAVQRLNLNT